MKSITELLNAYNRGSIPEPLLFTNLIFWIPPKSVDEILSVLDEEQRTRFKIGLVAISKPGWQFLDGGTFPEETLSLIREYVRKMGKSSADWTKSD